MLIWVDIGRLILREVAGYRMAWHTSGLSAQKFLCSATVCASAAFAGVKLFRKIQAFEAVRPELRSPRLFFPLSATNRIKTRLISNLFSRPTPLPPGVAVSESVVTFSSLHIKNETLLLQKYWDICEPVRSMFDAIHVRNYVPCANESTHKNLASGAIDGVIVWFHGGGLISGSYSNSDRYCGQLAKDTNCLVVSGEYRCAPDFPFPHAFIDCSLALLYAFTIAKMHSVPLIVSGVSAGGGLAAAVAQLAADVGIPVAYQALVYPMLDSRTGRYTSAGRGDFVWTPSANRFGWRSYLQDMRNVRDLAISRYAVPAQRGEWGEWGDLAPAWIGCGDLDLFFEENKRYAQCLQSAGVPTTFYTVEGMYHGADMSVPYAPVMKDFYQSMLQEIRRVTS